MMDFDKVGKTLDNIELPGWYRAVSWNVQPMHAQPAPLEPVVVARFQLVYTEPDVINLEPSVQRGRWWYVEEDFTYEAVIRTAWLALTVSDEHRRREAFSYRGNRIMDPHTQLVPEYTQVKGTGFYDRTLPRH